MIISQQKHQWGQGHLQHKLTDTDYCMRCLNELGANNFKNLLFLTKFEKNSRNRKTFECYNVAKWSLVIFYKFKPEQNLVTKLILLTNNTTYTSYKDLKTNNTCV